MSRREPNSVSGVKMLVAGGSSAAVVLTAAFLTGREAAGFRRRMPESRPSALYCGS
jgi:hypothetical protein